MFIAQKTHFTEAEAIKITIEHGFKGNELETSDWKKRGCLKDNGTFKALKEKLGCIYVNVEVVGKGKKRTYILSEKKEVVSERIYYYRGSVPKLEDTIMKEFVFNQLLENNSTSPKTYRSWSRSLGFFNTDSLPVDELIKIIKLLSGVTL
jgi:hypothetical protein